MHCTDSVRLNSWLSSVHRRGWCKTSIASCFKASVFHSRFVPYIRSFSQLLKRTAGMHHCSIIRIKTVFMLVMCQNTNRYTSEDVVVHRDMIWQKVGMWKFEMLQTELYRTLVLLLLWTRVWATALACSKELVHNILNMFLQIETS